MPPKRCRRGAAAISSLPPSSSSSWYSHHCSERFFSSLRQAEGRLASENGSSRQGPHSPSSSPLRQQRRPASSLLSSLDRSTEPSSFSLSPSLSAPMFIQPHRSRSAQPHSTAGDSSDPAPLELFTDSIPRESPPSFAVDGGRPHTAQDEAAGDVEEDVERLMDLLGLSDLCQGGTGVAGDGDGDGAHGWSNGGGDQDGRFLSKVAGVKGPKCRRDVARLDGWIGYYLHRRSSGGGGTGEKVKKEPARLAHLLLARAVCTNGGRDDDCGSDYFGEIGSPATMEEYLQHDPPTHASSLL